jgi:NADH/NAD ratio-sensing transcriptional regulator Rex
MDKNGNITYRCRRSKIEHIMMLEALRECYDNKISSNLAAKKVGINNKTARKYFTEWDKQIREGNHYAYLAEHEAEKKRIFSSLFEEQDKHKRKIDMLWKRLDKLKARYGK